MYDLFSCTASVIYVGREEVIPEMEGINQVIREGSGKWVRTFFHAAICSSFQIPGMCSDPPARAAMNVASVMARVPAVLVRCL